MAFVTYSQKEDMQNETFQIVTAYVIQIGENIRYKELMDAYDTLEALWSLIHTRVNDPLIETDLTKLGNTIYGDAEEINKNAALDEARRIFRKITAALDAKGLLFRMKATPGEMVLEG